MYTIRKVLPFWNERLPNDDGPNRAIALAEEVKSGRAFYDGAHKVRDQLWAQCDDLANESEELQVILGVGYGAAQALTVALEDEKFDPKKIDYGVTDKDIDPEDMDSSFFAAATFANGPAWDNESDSARRKTFWEWWIKDAVPYAWNTVS